MVNKNILITGGGGFTGSKLARKLNGAFNVGTGAATNVITVAATLTEQFEKKVLIKISGNYRTGDAGNNYAALSRIKKLLAFQAKFTFERSMKVFTACVNSQQVESDTYLLSIQEMKAKGLLK